MKKIKKFKIFLNRYRINSEAKSIKKSKQPQFWRVLQQMYQQYILTLSPFDETTFYQI